jgi:hypothetical protein
MSGPWAPRSTGRNRRDSVPAGQSLPAVRELFDHGWIHLVAIAGDTCRHYRADGTWAELPA